jgi:hypothetical protein|tara:strand:- start:4674 stop:5051 length:378 start_codon:yes stop_codon:yes gene_type:complete
MRYYILNYEVKTSTSYGGDYFHVNICNENLEEFHTYVYPQYNSKKIHNAKDWTDILQSGKGVVLSNLKAKAGAKMNHGSTLINADSIRKAEVEQVFDTLADMYDHVAKLMEEEEYTTGDNSLWEF